MQKETDSERRAEKGLQAALMSVFPIADFNSSAILEFSSYALGTPKYDMRECLEQGMTFAAPLKLRIRLVVFDPQEKGVKNSKVLDVREQESVRRRTAPDDGPGAPLSLTARSGSW